MKPPIVYLDTSFFIGLLENQAGRRRDAIDVLKYETREGGAIYTSILTLNEFTVRYYDQYKKGANCNQRIDEVVASIREIATPYGITDEIAKDAARLIALC
jgi:predicted nucleic acid-binding protein